MFMVSIILTSNDIISIVYHLKLTIFVKKKISYSLWQPPTLNDYLTTYMSGQTTELHRSCFKSSRGSYWLVKELLFLGTQICVYRGREPALRGTQICVYRG